MDEHIGFRELGTDSSASLRVRTSANDVAIDWGMRDGDLGVIVSREDARRLGEALLRSVTDGPRVPPPTGPSPGDLREVSILRQDVIETLRFVNELVVSLDRIGSSSAQMSPTEQGEILNRFVDEWDVFQRGAAVRRALSEYFDRHLGPDDMDELERELEGTIYWSPDGPRPAPDRNRWWREWVIE